jgi:hypothetical protein
MDNGADIPASSDACASVCIGFYGFTFNYVGQLPSVKDGSQ